MSKDKMLLYHTGFEVIKAPDVHHGRRNADFGQGFYMTTDADFAHRWAGVHKDAETVVNTYELDTTGLAVHRFQRDAEWFGYLFGNRNSKPDTLMSDVIIGPIANDTIYDTFGIITSGFLKPEDAMRLLLIGPNYQQIALKTEQAAERLTWLSAEILSPEQIAAYRRSVAAEEEAYQALFAEELKKINS